MPYTGVGGQFLKKEHLIPIDIRKFPYLCVRIGETLSKTNEIKRGVMLIL